MKRRKSGGKKAARKAGSAHEMARDGRRRPGAGDKPRDSKKGQIKRKVMGGPMGPVSIGRQRPHRRNGKRHRREADFEITLRAVDPQAGSGRIVAIRLGFVKRLIRRLCQAVCRRHGAAWNETEAPGKSSLSIYQSHES